MDSLCHVSGKHALAEPHGWRREAATDLSAAGGGMPRWSADGKQIIFVSPLPGKNTRAMLVSAQGGTPTELLPDDKNTEDDPAWSPDGKTLLLAQYPPQGFGGSAGE